MEGFIAHRKECSAAVDHMFLMIGNRVFCLELSVFRQATLTQISFTLNAGGNRHISITLVQGSLDFMGHGKNTTTSNAVTSPGFVTVDD